MTNKIKKLVEEIKKNNSNNFCEIEHTDKSIGEKRIIELEDKIKESQG